MSRELEVLSNIDELTKLYNRRWFNQKIEQLELNDWDDNLYSLVLCDIDNFKLINDKYGHHFGDNILVEISNILKENLTSLDYIVRWGGEEILILISREISESIPIVNRIRKIIENSDLQYNDEKVGVTMTFGVSKYQNHCFEENLIEADKAMYYGKENGKNCVVFKANSINTPNYIVTRD